MEWVDSAGMRKVGVVASTSMICFVKCTILQGRIWRFVGSF